MSEAYLISAGESSLEHLPGWLASRGVQTAWLDEIHWLMDESTVQPDNSATAYRWCLNAGEQQRLLHFILTGLRGGELELVMLAEIQAACATCLLLSNPASVGRRNLLPEYRLSAIPFEQAQSQQGLDLFFDQQESERMPLNRLLIYPQTQSVGSIDFPNAARMEAPPASSLITTLLALKSALTTKEPLGLLIQPGHHLALLMERL